MGSWGPWSSCTSSCGIGSTERSRQVSVPPRNGGTPCPDLKQRRGCFGNNAICSTAKGDSLTFSAFMYVTECSSLALLQIKQVLWYYLGQLLRFFCYKKQILSLHAPSTCHFADGTPEFPHWGIIKDISILSSAVHFSKSWRQENKFFPFENLQVKLNSLYLRAELLRLNMRCLYMYDL